MAPNPLFYQLLLVALVLICLILPIGWPDPRRPAPQTTGITLLNAFADAGVPLRGVSPYIALLLDHP